MNPRIFQETEDQDFSTTLILVPKIERAAAKFLDPAITGVGIITTGSGLRIEYPAWTNHRESIATLFETVGSVAGHPKDNGDIIAFWYSLCPVETAELLLEVAKWRTTPISEWSLADVVLRMNPAWRNPRPFQGEDGIIQEEDVLPSRMPAKEIAEILSLELAGHWKGRALPTADRLRVEVARLEKRRVEMMKKWEPVFRYNDEP